jgi:hypothetical protein
MPSPQDPASSPPQQPGPYDDTPAPFADNNRDMYTTPNYGDQFLNEQLTRNVMLFQTDIKPFSQEFLADQGLSVGCKTFWKKLHISLFDMSKILSLLQQQTFSYEESILHAKLLVNMGKVHYETFDYHNPLALTLPDEALYNYRHFLTRAVGGKEREYQSRIAFTNDSTQTQIIKDARGPPKKGRFFGLLPW